MPIHPVELQPDQVDVWLTRPDADWTPADLTHFETYLSDAERARGARYAQPRDARAHLVTRAMVRVLLSAYAGGDPQSWRFESGPYGKPSLHPEQPSPLRFNISHAQGRVACAFALGREVGVDVEDAERAVDLKRLAQRFFAPAEARALAALPTAQQRRRFFTYWTLKEAYIKVIGLGLAMPLDQFSFAPGGAGAPQVSFAPGRAGAPESWRFHEQALAPHHHLAVAAESPGLAQADWLNLRDFRPGDWREPA